MKLFNSMQAAALFVAWPFIIQWVQTAEFPGAAALFWAGCAVYVLGFGAIVYCIRRAME
jgi:drug/metabolite transporter (DMT)-like permease